MMRFRDLSTQYRDLRPKIDQTIFSVLANGNYINGPEVGLLEQKLATYTGVKHCISCGNGTDALQLALMAWGVGSGDAVFVPDFTFFASGEAPALLGATPVFVDVDKHTFNLDASKLEEAVCYVEESTDLHAKVVIAVDLFGLPANYPEIRKVCERHGLSLLEDGAQGFGGSIGSKMACSFGDISTTSFFPAKPLGCYGDGGAVFTNNDEWAELIRSYAVHGKGSMKYDNVRVGINSRLDTLQAAILLVKLEAFKGYELDVVNETACFYGRQLKEINFELPHIPSGFHSSWAQYTVQLPRTCDRDAFQDYLRKASIPTMVYYPKPMHLQQAFGKVSLCLDGCPTAKYLCNSVVSLPFGPHLEIEDALQVVTRIHEYVGR